MLIMLNKAPDKEVVRTSGQKPFHFCMFLNFPNLKRGKFGINEKKKFIALRVTMITQSRLGTLP